MFEFLFVLCIGALMGSFIGLIAARYQPISSNQQWLENITVPSSHCSYCKHSLALIDMIPLLSWILYRGRCRYCHTAIGKGLFFIELISSLSAGLVFLISANPGWLILIFFNCLLILLAAIDSKWHLLPDILTQLLLWGGLLSNCWLQWLTFNEAILGAVAGYLSFRCLNILYFIFRGIDGIGQGDAKLFAAIGAWCGWQALPIIATLAALLALIYVLYKRHPASIAIPFGPWLAVAAWISIMIRLSQYHFYALLTT